MNPLCVRKTFFVPELQSYLRTCTYVYPADPRSRIQSQIHVKVKNNRHGISQELWGVSSVHSRSIKHIHHMSSKLSSGGNKACPSLRSIALVEARQQLALSIWKLIESFGAKFIPLLKKRKGASILHRSTVIRAKASTGVRALGGFVNPLCEIYFRRHSLKYSEPSLRIRANHNRP